MIAILFCQRLKTSSLKKQLLLYFLLIAFVAQAQKPLQDYIFFANSRMSRNYYYTSTSSSGLSVIRNENQKLPVDESIFFTPGNSLRLEYTDGINGNWRAVVYRPEIRAQDHFKNVKFLSFHLYNVAATSESLPMIQLMSVDSTLSKKCLFRITKTDSWEQIVIPIDSFGIKIDNAPYITSVVFSQQGSDGTNHTIYVDDIEFLSTTSPADVTAQPVITAAKGFAKHVDIQWQFFSDDAIKYVKIYRAEDGKDYKPVGIQIPMITRYTDFTGETGKSYSYKISFLSNNYQESNLSEPVSAQTRPMTDDDLLSMVQEACFRYYWEGAEPNSGLAREDIPGRQNMIAIGASGFGMMALIVGTERNFISREQSVERFTKITEFLEKAETFHGALAHFMDGLTKKVEPFFGIQDNGGDLVETSFLMQGLLAARAYFNQDNEKEKTIRDKITQIWERVEWDWYKQFPDSKFLYWHWSPDQAFVINHNLIGWNETMVTYLLAIASPTHAVPASMYYTGWATQEKRGQDYRSAWGGTKEGSMYTNGNTYFGIKLDVGVSNGGPLFFTHYSYMGYDPHFIADKYTNYFTNNKNIALINYRYCVKNPNHFKGYGDSCWGLSACDGPITYTADEPVKDRDLGKITPTGAISSFPYTPAESMKALKNYYNNYGKFLWGEYGFRDAFDLTQNWCSEIYMGLNQGPMVVMMENYRTGLIWKLFMSNPEIKDGLKKLEDETRNR